MNISRRSFLKMAALSTAAVAVSASMTGCATVFTPNLSITYQEVDKTTGKAKKDGVTKDVKGWTDGKKIVSGGDVPGLGLFAPQMEFSTADLKSSVESQLKNDKVDLAGKAVKIYVKGDATTIKATWIDASHCTIEAKFYIE